MRIENVSVVFIALLLCVGWWVFKDPALAGLKIEQLVAASRVWRS
jgi:hypothetical protein